MKRTTSTNALLKMGWLNFTVNLFILQLAAIIAVFVAVQNFWVQALAALTIGGGGLLFWNKWNQKIKLYL